MSKEHATSAPFSLRAASLWMLAGLLTIGVWGSTELVAMKRASGILVVLASPVIGLAIYGAWYVIRNWRVQKISH